MFKLSEPGPANHEPTGGNFCGFHRHRSVYLASLIAKGKGRIPALTLPWVFALLCCWVFLLHWDCWRLDNHWSAYYSSRENLPLIWSSPPPRCNYYLIGLTAYACMQVAVRGFYALKAPVIPVIAAVLAIMVNIVLSLHLGYRWGAAGLALAYSIAGWIDLLILLAALRWKVGPVGGTKIMRVFLISLGASMVMFLAIWGVGRAYHQCLHSAARSSSPLVGTDYGRRAIGICFIVYWFKLEETGYNAYAAQSLVLPLRTN